VGDHLGHPLDTVNERAWKNDLWSLVAAFSDLRPGVVSGGVIKFVNKLLGPSGLFGSSGYSSSTKQTK
jgi:hypothetical protein